MKNKEVCTAFKIGWEELCKRQDDEIKDLAVVILECLTVSLKQAMDFAFSLYKRGVRAKGIQ